MAGRVIRKVQTSDRELNQVQDQLVEIVNPAIRDIAARLPRNETLEPNTQDAWDDALGPTVQGLGAAALSQDDFPENGAAFQAIMLAHNSDDQLSFTTQMPHGWNRGPVNPHVHLTPMVAPAADQVARFTMQYAWAHVRGKVPSLASWTTSVRLLTITPGDALTEMVVSWGLITPPPGMAESALFRWVVIRTGTDPGDTYTTNKGWGTIQANLAVTSFDVHYVKAKAGTSTQFPEI